MLLDRVKSYNGGADASVRAGPSSFAASDTLPDPLRWNTYSEIIVFQEAMRALFPPLGTWIFEMRFPEGAGWGIALVSSGHGPLLGERVRIVRERFDAKKWESKQTLKMRSRYGSGLYLRLPFGIWSLPTVPLIQAFRALNNLAPASPGVGVEDALYSEWVRKHACPQYFRPAPAP